MRACKHTIYINFESALYLYMCPNKAYNTLLFMQIAILLHDLQLHLIIINVYTDTILKLYITY